MKIRLYFFSFLFFIISSLVFFFWWNNYSKFESTDNAYVRGSITTISSRIDGYIHEVPGVLNTRVKKGDILVKFDREPFEAIYDTVKAELRGASAKIAEIDANIQAEIIKIDEKTLNIKFANAKIASEEAKKSSELSNLKMFENEKSRLEKLFENRTVTKSQLERSIANYENSLYKVDQFGSDIKASKIKQLLIKKEIQKLKNNINKLEAEKERFLSRKDALLSKLKSVKIDLDSTTVRSPIDGIIANRIVEPGVYMKKGWQLMSIVPVADVWVIANFKETQLKNIKKGQDTVIKVDAFSNLELTGKVLSISPASASSFSLIPPQNASGNFVKVVQRIPVKITLNLPQGMIGKIVPGLSVYAKIKISK